MPSRSADYQLLTTNLVPLLPPAALAARRRYRLLAGGLAALVAVAYALSRRAGHDWGDDFAQYLQHARNLLAGQPYKTTGHLLNPRYQIAPEVYPPIFPLLLAPVVALVGPFELETLKLVGIGCFALFLVVWGRSLEADARAEGLALAAWPQHLLPLLAVGALCPVAWELKDHILSELPFLLCQQVGLLAVAAWSRRRAGSGGELGMRMPAVLLGGALYLLTGCRTLGGLLIGAFCLETLAYYYHLGRAPWRRVRYEGLALLVCGGLLLAQQAWLNAHDAGYGAQLRQYFSTAQVWANVQEYWFVGCHFWGRRLPLADWQYAGLGTGLLLLVGGGWGRQWRRGPWQATELYAAAYLLAVVLWPMPQGGRYLLPLLPLAVRYGWLGARGVPGVGGRVLPSLLALLLLVAGFRQIKADRRQPLPDRYDTPDTARLFGWVRGQPPGSVFIFPKPRALYLHTGHPAMAPANPTDSALTEQDIRYAHARYLIVARHSPAYHPRGARLRLQTEAWQVLELP